MKNVKRDKLDIVFSQLVRRKSRGICAVGILYPDVCKSPCNDWKYGMDCSHTGYGRRNRSTRYSFLNCDAVCKGCHGKLGESGIFANAFKRKQLGSKKFNQLLKEGNTIVKRTKQDREELYQDLKFQLKELNKDFDYV